MSAHKFQLNFSVLAQKDIDHVLAYTSEYWGAKQLIVYKKKIDHALSAIIQYPYKAPERSVGVRMVAVEKHRIYYRIHAQSIIIVRILHERMDEGAHVSH